MNKFKDVTLFQIYEVETNDQGKIIPKAKTKIAFKDIKEAADYCNYLNNNVFVETQRRFYFFEENIKVFKKANDLISDPNEDTILFS